MSSDDLREIFSYRGSCVSDTHDSLCCKRCKSKDDAKGHEQVGNPSEDQIALWGHHRHKADIIDDVLRDSDQNNNISFVFELRVPPMAKVVPPAATT